MGGVTKRQHYIPKIILRGHAIPYHSKHIWLYDNETGLEKMVSISDVCTEKYLYEFRDDNGDIFGKYKNHLERVLSAWEGTWAKTLSTIRNHDDMTEEMAVSLYLMTATQMLRMPNIMAVSKQFVSHNYPDLNQYEADRAAKLFSFLCGELTPERHPIFASVIDNLVKYPLYVFDTTHPLILPMQAPVQFWRVYNRQYYHDLWVFPVAHNQCVVLEKSHYKRAYLMMSDNEVKLFNNQLLNGRGKYFLGSVQPSRFLEVRQNA